MSTLHRMTRAGALALAGLTAASVSSGASPEQAQGPPLNVIVGARPG